MRLADPRKRSGPRSWQLALLAGGLLGAQLLWFESDELAGLAAGFGELRQWLRTADDPGAFRPHSLHVVMNEEARAKLDDHVARSFELGNIPHSDDDWVKARLEIGGRRHKVRARLKGDFLDHLRNGLSLRIKLRGDDRFWGMRTFSVQHPATRFYFQEYGYVESARREGLVAPRHDFVEFALDDEPPRPYLLIEHTAKQMLERQRRRDGVILKFDEGDLFAGKLLKRRLHGPDVALRAQPESAPLVVLEAGRIAESPELSELAALALERFEAFRRGEVAASELFDVGRTGRWLAISNLWGAQHALNWHNPRYYYDPVRGRFEPVARDGNADARWGDAWQEWFEKHGRWVWERFLEDPLVNRAYTRALWRMTEPAYVEAMLAALEPELNPRIPFLMRDALFAGNRLRWTNLGWVQVQARFLRETLRAERGAEARWRREPNGSLSLLLSSQAGAALELVAVGFADGSSAQPQLGPDDPAWPLLPLPRHPRAGGAPRVLRLELPPGSSVPREVELRIAGAPQLGTRSVAVAQVRTEARPAEVARTLARAGDALLLADPPAGPALPAGWTRRAADGLLWVEAPPGEHLLERDLVLPRPYALRLGPGTRLRAAPGVAVVVHGPVWLEGTAERPVVLGPRDDSWEGLVVLGADRPSRLEHVRFSGVAPSPGARGPRRAGWVQTGGIVFADSDVEGSHLELRDFATEDAFNAVRARVSLSDVSFEDVVSDAFDGDFVDATLEDVRLRRTGGDGIDLSGSVATLRGVLAEDVRDKAVSIGEASRVLIEGLETRKGSFAVVAKDGSAVEVRDLSVRDTWVGLAAFTKKAEFGPARLEARGLELEGRSFSHLAQAGSEIILDGRRLPTRSFDVADLYAP